MSGIKLSVSLKILHNLSDEITQEANIKLITCRLFASQTRHQLCTVIHKSNITLITYRLFTSQTRHQLCIVIHKSKITLIT